jgi:hypothetical protein
VFVFLLPLLRGRRDLDVAVECRERHEVRSDIRITVRPVTKEWRGAG